MGEGAIRIILSKENALRPQNRERPSLPLNETHRKVGLRLNVYRTATVPLTRTQAAEKLNWSAKKVAGVEDGRFHLSLHDLEDLSSFMNLKLSELLKDL